MIILANFCFSEQEIDFQADIIYMDFAKALDRVSPYILILKLRRMGFH